MENCCIHIHIGHGKGKTTSAYGTILRGLGHNFKVACFSFLKFQKSGEMIALSEKYKNNFSLFINDEINYGFFFNLNDTEKEQVKRDSMKLFNKLKEIILSRSFDIIVLDEILDAVDLKLIPQDELTDILKKNDFSEIILTGRKAYEDLIAISDYVTEFNNIKHPYQHNQKARKGIEY